MASVYFRELVEKHPETLQDRHNLSFTAGTAVKAAERYRQTGVILMRDVLPSPVVDTCREAFAGYVRGLGKRSNEVAAADIESGAALDAKPNPKWDTGETSEGSYHSPWAVRHDGRFPTAIVLTALIRSWAWPVIESICGSTDIMVMFGMCVARHRFDEDLLAGVHQDAVAVNPDVPLAIWIPLGDVEPRKHSGLGFIVPAPDGVIAAKEGDEGGTSYLMDRIANTWMPHYRPGDLSMHSRYCPHFTTGYGTNSERYSLEIRLWARDDQLVKYGDPSITISRRNGVPVVVETRGSPNTGAHGFLANAALLAMQSVSADLVARADAAELAAQIPIKPHQSLPKALLQALRSLVR